MVVTNIFFFNIQAKQPENRFENIGRLGIFYKFMYRSNQSFNIPPGQPPGHSTLLKIIVQIPPCPGQNAVQMPHTRVRSGDQMPPPWGHFTGT